MTVSELYAFLNEKIPPSLSCEWDNDGLMCCPEPTREVRRVLICLDATAEMVEKAIEENFDVILTHHPLVFHKLPALEPSIPVAKKLMDLCRAGIAVMSFHTRLDALEGGVNDTLASLLGLRQVVPFGEEKIGRIGSLEKPIPFVDFIVLVREKLGCPAVVTARCHENVRRVAVLGGNGSDDVPIAAAAGADTYLSGEIAFHHFSDAPENGMNLIAAGHYYTEAPVCRVLSLLVTAADPSIETKIAASNTTVTY